MSRARFVGRPAAPRRLTRRHASAAAGLLLLAFAGCASAGSEPQAAPREIAQFGAALAFIRVENQTEHRLNIAFRPVAGVGGEVGIGSVDPGREARLAPVPAEEAIRLVARTPDARWLELPARSLDIGERWTWVIPEDAPFRDPTS